MDLLLQQAVELKQQQVERERQVFNSYPLFVRWSIFHYEDEFAPIHSLSSLDNFIVHLVAYLEGMSTRGKTAQVEAEALLLLATDDQQQLAFLHKSEEAKMYFAKGMAVFSCLFSTDAAFKQKRHIQDSQVKQQFVDLRAVCYRHDKRDGYLQSVQAKLVGVALKLSELRRASKEHVEAIAELTFVRERYGPTNLRLCAALASLLCDASIVTISSIRTAAEILDRALVHHSNDVTDAVARDDAVALFQRIKREMAADGEAERRRYSRLFQRQADENNSPPQVVLKTAKSTEDSKSWEDHVAMTRHIIQYRRSQNPTCPEAAKLENGLMIAAAQKLFNETMAPNRHFDLCLPTRQVLSAAQSLHLDIALPLVHETCGALYKDFYLRVEPMFLTPDWMLQAELARCNVRSAGMSSAELKDALIRERSRMKFDF